jgi:ribosomal protein S18 acetylase RimI-like enzyme
MEVFVRKAKLGDEASIARVHVAAWKAAYTEFMDSEFLNSLSIMRRKEIWENALRQPGRGKYLVAEVQKNIQGFAVFGPARDSDLDESAIELVALNVHPAFWRQNLGTSLLKVAVESVSQEKYKTLHLWVIKGNAPAIKLYEKFGFKYLGKSKTDSNHSGNPLHELRYSRSLG